MAVAQVASQHTGDFDGFVTSTSTSANLSIVGSDIAVVAHPVSGNSTDAPTGVTWDNGGGVAMTSQVEQSGTGVHVGLWTLLAPTGPSAGKVITATWGGSQGRAWVGASSYSGVDSIGNTQSGSGTTAEPSLTVTGVGADDMIADVVAVFGGTSTFTVGANQTKLVESTTFFSYYIAEASTSYQDGTDGGVMSWTTGSSDDWAHAAVALLAPASGVTGTISNTLANVTSTFSGTFIALTTGTIGLTLGADTSTISATFTSPAATGTIVETLDDVTPTASGVVIDLITGSSAITLADVTSAMQGEMGYTGTLAVTLGSDTLAAVGAHASVIGTITETLDDVVPTITGQVRWTGSIGETLDDVSLTASATFVSDTITGTIGVTLDGVTVTASGIGGEVIERQFIDDVVTELVINLIEEEVN